MNVVVSASRGDDGNVDVGTDAIQILEKVRERALQESPSDVFWC
jgi:hypothetical protein